MRTSGWHCALAMVLRDPIDSQRRRATHRLFVTVLGLVVLMPGAPQASAAAASSSSSSPTASTASSQSPPSPPSPEAAPRTELAAAHPAVAAADSSADRWSLFPADDLFAPLIADPKQPRFFGSMRGVWFDSAGVPAESKGKRVLVGLVGLGGEFGLVQWRNDVATLQLGVTAGVFSQFNLSMPSADLVNSDFFVGVPLAVGRGPLAARVRLYHQSSHLGDEFLGNNPGVTRLDLSFEGADALLSGEVGPMRLYGGGGVIFGENTPMPPGSLQWGAELYSPSWVLTILGEPQVRVVGAADFQWWVDRDAPVSTSLKVGIESTAGRAHHFRFLVGYMRGLLGWGQFFASERIQNVGIETQFDY